MWMVWTSRPCDFAGIFRSRRVSRRDEVEQRLETGGQFQNGLNERVPGVMLCRGLRK